MVGFRALGLMLSEKGKLEVPFFVNCFLSIFF